MSDISDRIRALYPTISKVLSASGCPGLSLGVLHHGNIIHTAHFGRQDVEKHMPPNDDTVYRVASLTKAITASAIAILVAEGALDWDTPIREHLPELGDRKDAIGQEATLRDLLSNRTGISRADDSWGRQFGEVLLSKDEMFRMSRHIGVVKPFRSTFAYSQWNYVLAAQVVEKVIGTNLEDFICEKLLVPLGLERTMFGIPSGENISKAHGIMNDGTAVRLPFVDSMDEASHGMGAAWGMKSSVKDLLLFYKSMLSAYSHQTIDGVDTTPGSPFKLMRTVMSPQIAIGRSNIEDEGYCFGLHRLRLPKAFGSSFNGVLLGPLKIPLPIIGKTAKDTNIYFHNGTFPGQMASAFLLPSSESAVVVLSNGTPFMDATDFVGQMLVSLLLGEQSPANIAKLSEQAKAVSLSSYARLAARLEKEKTAKPPQYPLEAYEGTYWNSLQNIRLNIKVHPREGLKLTVQDFPLTHYDLFPHDGNTFYWPADRDQEMRKAMYPITSLPRHKIAFSASGDGSDRIDTLTWHHDPMGRTPEVFRKRARLQKSAEKLKL